MSLPQLLKKILYPYFGNGIATIRLSIFFFPFNFGHSTHGQQNWAEEIRYHYCRNSTKVGERKINSRREKFLIFGNGIAAIPSAHSTARVGARNVSVRKKNQMTWKKKMLRNL